MNLLHDIPAGSAEKMNVIIEIPKGSNNKYEIDKETGMIKLDRANYSAASFPFDYGFVPQTLWHDGDALDVIVLTTYPLFPGVLVNARPIGIMEMIDGGESDNKVLAVPTEDKRWDDVKDIGDLNQHTLREFKHFFETYKALKGKENPVSVGTFKGREDAAAAFEESRKLYMQKGGK